MTQIQQQDGWDRTSEQWSGKGASEQKANYLSWADNFPPVKKYKRQTFDALDITEGDYILDVGCGRGNDARAMAEQVGRSGKVIGIDIDPGLIDDVVKLTQGLKLPLEFREGNVYSLDFKDNTFDACRTDRTLQHLENPQKALTEMVRVLKPGGRIVVSEPDWGSLTLNIPANERDLTRKIINYWADTRTSGWIARQLPGLFEECGLVHIEVEAISISGAMRAYNWSPKVDFIALVKSAAGATSDGLITQDEADMWLQNLKKAEETGHFLAHLGGFMVSGQKP